jgi:hypothetical protein
MLYRGKRVASTEDALALVGALWSEYGHIACDEKRPVPDHTVGLYVSAPSHGVAELFQLLLGGETIITPKRGVWFVLGQYAVACADTLAPHTDGRSERKLKRFVAHQQSLYTNTGTYNAMHSEEVCEANPS